MDPGAFGVALNLRLTVSAHAPTQARWFVDLERNNAVNARHKRSGMRSACSSAHLDASNTSLIIIRR